MSDTPTAVAIAAPAPRASWKDVIPALALIITVIGLFVGGGRLIGSVEDHTRRLDALETRAQRRDDEASDLKAKISGIDAKLDLLLQRAGAKLP